jgi:predicted NBD/HSP70 family sugar kinase
MSDEAVLRALMRVPRLTRAEIAAVTRLSKPTAAEAIRRLETVGLVHDTGERTSGRGGVGSYYALTADVGVALAVSIAPSGIAVERLDTAGQVLGRHVEPVGRPASSRTVARLLTKAVRAALSRPDAAPIRVAVVSAADPVDRGSGSLVHLPDAPFLVGALSPARILAPLVDGPVIVDNDVNWEARAERDVRAGSTAPGLDDFVYLHLGEGLGCAVVADGEVRRGHSGLAGEIAHLITSGADGRAVAFTTVFDQLGLRHAGSTAIDVDALLGRITGADGARAISVLATAVCDVITAAIGLGDPHIVVIGGDWGTAAPIYAALQARMGQLPRSVPLDLNRARGNSALTGARSTAVDHLRADIINRSKTL